MSPEKFGATRYITKEEVTCFTCAGAGEVQYSSLENGNYVEYTSPCSACGGRGWKIVQVETWVD